MQWICDAKYRWRRKTKNKKDKPRTCIHPPPPPPHTHTHTPPPPPPPPLFIHQVKAILKMERVRNSFACSVSLGNCAWRHRNKKLSSVRDAGGAQMAHPARPERSKQNHHATKDHQWHSKKSMCWFPLTTSQSPSRRDEDSLQANRPQNKLQKWLFFSSPGPSGTGTTCLWPSTRTFCAPLPPPLSTPHPHPSPRSALGVRPFHYSRVCPWQIEHVSKHGA